MAIASDRVRADMVESIEFPQLANKYDVYGVPRSVINEDTYVEGALPEELYVAYLKNAVGQLSDEDLEQKMREALGDGEEPEIQEL
jgi:predicted DsbA family dithiol-disulfide isomerase